jgi:steroid delta-isomerase-like uncharacterized protein
MSRTDLERLDDLGLAAWDNHKPQDFAEMFADDFVLRDLTLAEPLRTREAVVAFMESWDTAFPDMRLRASNRVVGEDSVAAEYEFTGTNTGPLTMGGLEMPPTGRSVVGRGAYFVRVRDGKVVEFSSHPDVAGLMTQLGFLPQG